VGSSRKGLAADAGDYRFVAPDNGVLTAVFREFPPKKVVDVTDRRYIRPTVSRTFEGRDRFAPAAAWIALGIQLSALGRPVTTYHMLDLPLPAVTDESIDGMVLRIDRFGNLVSNIDRRTFDRLQQTGKVRVQAGDTAIERLVATYAEIAPGEVCALFGSTDHLEIALREARAAERLGLRRGAPVRVMRV
jgi:S-adenosylmethionine hydrolase